MNTTERASHPSRAQIEYLLEFLEKNPSLAKGFSKVPSARDASRKTWENLTLKLNSLGGCVKTWKQWTKYWADKKSAVKKKAALRFKNRNATGGGIESVVVELSEVEERILVLMGGESFSIGDRHLDINPFEESHNIAQYSPSLLVQSNEAGTSSLNFSYDLRVDAPTADIETPQPIQIVECIPGTSQPSARQSVRIVIPRTPSPQEVAQSPARTPPRVGPSSPLQQPTPSSSGNYPRRRRLNFSHTHAPRNTTSSSRVRIPRRRSPPSQRQSHFVSITDRFLSLEEQRIEMDRRNSLMMDAFLSHQRERDLSATEALKAIAESLKMLAEAINPFPAVTVIFRVLMLMPVALIPYYYVLFFQ